MSGLQPPSLGELQHAAKEYLDEHEADTAQQDERYRARIFKELSKATHERSEVHRQLEAVRTELKAQASEEKKRTEQLELAFKTEFEMVQTVLKELKDLKYMSFVSAQAADAQTKAPQTLQHVQDEGQSVGEALARELSKHCASQPAVPSLRLRAASASDEMHASGGVSDGVRDGASGGASGGACGHNSGASGSTDSRASLVKKRIAALER
jgi:hypothetical protein